MLETNDAFDGSGLPTKRVNIQRDKDWDTGEVFTTTQTSYVLHAAGLGGKVVAELDAQGNKITGHDYLQGMELAKETIWNLSANYARIEWQHTDPVTGSNITSNLVHQVEATQELDPLGADVTTAPDPGAPLSPPYLDVNKSAVWPLELASGLSYEVAIPDWYVGMANAQWDKHLAQDFMKNGREDLAQEIIANNPNVGIIVSGVGARRLADLMQLRFDEEDGSVTLWGAQAAKGLGLVRMINEEAADPQKPAQTRQPATDPQCDARIAAIFGGPGAVAATVDEPPGVNAGAARYRYDHLAGQGVFHIYTDANGSDKVTGLFIPPGGRLVSGGEYDNHGDTENFFRYSYTSGPYKGVQIALVHVGGTHGGEEGGQYLGNFHVEKNAMGSIRIGNIAGLGGEGDGYNHTHVKVYLNGKLTDPRKVFCK